MTKFNTSLFWFSYDLRIEDNPALLHAAQKSRQLLCVYIVDPAWFAPNRYGLKSIGENRWQFLLQSILSLKSELESIGQRLLIVEESPLDAIPRLISRYNIDAVFRSQQPGYFENHQWQIFQGHYPQIPFQEFASNTLFDEQSLPFMVEELPGSFSRFRKQVEKVIPVRPIVSPDILPAPPKHIERSAVYAKSSADQSLQPLCQGGNAAAQAQLRSYFESDSPASYKLTRNALDGWENSTKFSPWLSTGCLSPHQILQKLNQFEQNVEANESTYWIRFELLWREYFQWLAHRHRVRMFYRGGTQGKKCRHCFYPERFQRWCQGNTPFPLVNACMKQLNATGFMSNRGRQLVASCFVNELDMDWRYGAAYFEQQLIDYDVASNWGNWQYLAGVGVDPRGKRRFDLDKQAAQYDPEGEFVAKWRGNDHCGTLDSVDAADWPIYSD